MTGPGVLVAGRYRLRSQLGGGGMGAVWLARDELLGREVAVKQVLVPVGIDAALAAANREAAMREGRIAARLSHPHAVAVYDMVLDEGQPWLVMEYLPSVSLATMLHERGILPTAEVAQIGAQVADALAATHAAGVVHRDVKPGNILIGTAPGREGLVKITDFGISRAVGDVSLTQTGVVKGTPAFLAPEVAQGSPPDEASDVFSLGATLYACLEGTPPFGLSDNALQMLHRVAGGDFSPPHQAGVLTAPLMRMLSADPARRPTMLQVRDELAKLAAGPDRDVTEVLTARTLLPRTLPGLPGRQKRMPSGRAPAAAAAASAAAAAAPRTAVETPAPAAAAGSPAPATAVETPAPAGAAGSTPAADPTSRPPRSAPPPVEPPDRRPPAPAARPDDGRAAPRRRRWAAVLAALLVVGAVAALLVFLTSRPDDPVDPAAETPATTSAAPTSAEETTGAEQTTEPETTSPETTTATTTPPEETDDGPVTAAEIETFLRDYYGLLPGDPDTAYARTGPTLQGISSIGDYRAFWSGFRSVELGSVQASDGQLSATAEVTFVADDGEVFPEVHEIVLVEGPDGQLLVDSDRPV
ncbi:serine/threonine-protein kinase [Modestobacter sp. URMC 112]